MTNHEGTDTLKVQPHTAPKELHYNSKEAKKVVILSVFSNLKRSGGRPRAWLLPLKMPEYTGLFFKVSSFSQSYISLLLTPPFLISLFLPLSQWSLLKFKHDAFPAPTFFTPAALSQPTESRMAAAVVARPFQQLRQSPWLYPYPPSPHNKPQ